MANYNHPKYEEITILISEKLKGKTMQEVEDILYCVREYIKENFTLEKTS